ncbi:O-methyltransferase [Croceiramulus getboli]|nr:class I SAM-dependent methyltransferase [Flavobacteriaceae bacterium YJPT1-3]
MVRGYRILAYLKWLPKTFHLHGIHSPFVYQLQRDCLHVQDKNPSKAVIALFNQARLFLLRQKTSIAVCDFGAGSIKLGEQRSIRSIVRHVSASPSRMRLLYRLSSYFEVIHALELGTSVGLGTLALSQGAKQVTTWEGCPESATLAQSLFKKYQISNVELVVGSFRACLQELDQRRQESETSPCYDLLYLDGHHEEQATKDYFDKLLFHTHPQSVVILDDIYWSPGMTRAWRAIQQHPQVTVSVDCFFFGLVFFKKDQAKEYFHIRI